MKTTLSVLFVLFSGSAMADSYWLCQCFEGPRASVPYGGSSVDEADSLRDAERIALRDCSETDSHKRLARCLQFVKTDH
jgi:hypothetical protein